MFMPGHPHLIRDLTEGLGSRLQEWGLPSQSTKISIFQKRQEHLKLPYTSQQPPFLHRH